MSTPASAQPVLRESVVVDAARIRWDALGPPPELARGDLLLVHGSGAHHRWWHAVVPLLVARWRVLVVDLSGHGESDHRPDYDPGTWAAELTAVVGAAGGRPVVVGAHSLGARVAVLLAAARPDLVHGLVVLDSELRLPDRLVGRIPPRVPRRARVFRTRAEGLSRFRLVPDQPHPGADLVDPVAAHSLKAVEGGWTWRHDVGGFPPVHGTDVLAAAAAVTAPVLYVAGADSPVVGPDDVEFASSTFPDCTTVTLSGGYHHLPVELPTICAGLLDDWGTRCLPRPSPTG